jgi:Na+/melibiose symporter-like transporter
MVCPITLRLLGAFPENGDPLLLPLVFLFMVVGSIIGGVSGISIFSMMSDIVREHEYVTGMRRDGIFFAANSFSQKINSGLGNAMAGILIDLIRFPVNSNPDTIAPETVMRLGILFISAASLNLAAAFCLCFYKITRQRHDEIMTALKAKRR